MKHIRLFSVIALFIVLSSCEGVRVRGIVPDLTFAVAQKLTLVYNSAEYELTVVRKDNNTEITVLGEGTLAGAVIGVCGEKCVIKHNGLEMESELSALPGDTFFGVLCGVLSSAAEKKPALTKSEAGEYEYCDKWESYDYTLTADENGKVAKIAVRSNS